jgi:hypothetical protein
LDARVREETSVAMQLSDAETALADAERQLASEDSASLEDVIAAADVARARLEAVPSALRRIV